jgi:hypothetical protein
MFHKTPPDGNAYFVASQFFLIEKQPAFWETVSDAAQRSTGNSGNEFGAGVPAATMKISCAHDLVK